MKFKIGDKVRINEENLSDFKSSDYARFERLKTRSTYPHLIISDIETGRYPCIIKYDNGNDRMAFNEEELMFDVFDIIEEDILL